MRIIRITTNYAAYLAHFYAQHPTLYTEPYRKQYESLMEDCYSWADFWMHALKTFGYEMWEPVGNAEAMQKAWAREHDVRYRDETYLTEIIAAQVKYFAPEIVFVNDYVTYTAEFFRQLRQECPSIRLVIGWCGAPYSDGGVFREYDLVLSNIPSLVAHFRQEGHHCELFRHAFAPVILEKIAHGSEAKIPFSFLGSLMKNTGFHNQREQVLSHLLRQTDLQIWSALPPITPEEIIRIQRDQTIFDMVQFGKKIPGVASLLRSIPKLNDFVLMGQRPQTPAEIDLKIFQRAHPALFGLAMYQQLSRSQITLNTHIDISLQFASNMRLYEATGVGTCLLTEKQQNLSELFEPDVEVATYDSPEEATEKVHYLLEHDDERRKIAAAGQKRTLRDHTFAIRSQQLDRIIKHSLR